MITKFSNFINESFDNQRDTIIVIQSPEEYHKIINDFINWGYEYYMEGEWEENELESINYYPFSLTTDKFNGFFIDMVEDDDFEDYNLGDNHNVYHSIDDFYSDVNGVNFIKYKGIIKPNYNPKKNINNLNEQFDIKKDIAINIDTVNDYKRLKRYLDEWHYKSSELQLLDEEDLEEDYNYPILIVFYDLLKSEYMIHFDDPYGEQLEEGEIEKCYNLYKSTGEFLLDREAVNYIKNKGILVPNYKPKKRSI